MFTSLMAYFACTFFLGGLQLLPNGWIYLGIALIIGNVIETIFIYKNKK